MFFSQCLKNLHSGLRAGLEVSIGRDRSSAELKRFGKHRGGELGRNLEKAKARKAALKEVHSSGQWSLRSTQGFVYLEAGRFGQVSYNLVAEPELDRSQRVGSDLPESRGFLACAPANLPGIRSHPPSRRMTALPGRSARPGDARKTGWQSERNIHSQPSLSASWQGSAKFIEELNQCLIRRLLFASRQAVVDVEKKDLSFPWIVLDGR
jgi:hypothetical protein